MAIEFLTLAAVIYLLLSFSMSAGLRWLERFLYAQASHIVVNSPAYRQYLIDQGIAETRISLVPNDYPSATIFDSYTAEGNDNGANWIAHEIGDDANGYEQVNAVGVYGGADVGAYISEHPLVEEIHMTGSDKTYEAVVFGGGEEGRRRKQARDPLNTKPFTAELGNVSPVIVVPGPWKPGDIDEYAKHIATWMTVNADTFGEERSPRAPGSLTATGEVRAALRVAGEPHGPGHNPARRRRRDDRVGPLEVDHRDVGRRDG